MVQLLGRMGDGRAVMLRIPTLSPRKLIRTSCSTEPNRQGETMNTTETEPKPRSEKRRRQGRIEVRVTEEEREAITEAAINCGLSTPEYLRRLGLNHEPNSVADQRVFLEVLKLHKDLNRVGGLIKLWLSERETKLPQEAGIGVGELRVVLQDLRRISNDVKKAVMKL